MTQELVQVFKDEGTKAFQNGQYELAIEKYTKGIDILQKIQDANCDEKRAALEFNISTCYFKLEKLESSLSFAENALKYNPNYIKALYRKAAILKDLKNLEESTRFLRTILVLDPSNKEAKELSETIRSQLLQQDQENKDPLALLQKELEEFDKNKEISLKVYQQFLLENIETPQDALKAQKKCKLGEAFLEHVIAESDMTKINYFLIYTNYFYKMLYKPLFDLNTNNQVSTEQLQLIDFLFGDSSSTLNSLIQQVYQKFTSLNGEEEIQNNFFKIFRFIQILNLTQQDAIQGVVSLFISLHQLHQKDLIIETIRTCLRLNLVSLANKTISSQNKASLFEKPLVSLLEYLQKISTATENSAINECIIVGMDFYLQIQGIRSFEEFKESFLSGKSFLTNSLIIVYALLFINYDIGSKHFQSLVTQKEWEGDFVGYLSDPKSNVNSRKLVFEILSLYIKEIEGCKEILAKKNFMNALIEGLTMGNSPLFQLKIIVILVKLVLRQPSEEVVKQFETILNPPYLKSLLDYLINNKEPRAILEFMELILGLSYVEDFKVKLSKIPALFKNLDKFMSTQFQERSQQNSLNLAMLLFLVNMLTDAKGENTEKQKQKFQIQDEDLKKLEEVIQRSNQTQAVIPTYTVDYFTKVGIPTTILDSINIENFCRVFINNAEFIKSSKLLREYLPKFLYKLGSYNQKEKSKFVRKDIIRLCLLIWDNSNETPIKEEISKFLSEILVTCNPATFDFAEAIQITDILAFAVFHNSHELTLFEATSSLVQFSGLNEDICDRILTKHKMWGTLVLNLCEENDYIVHATLELMNNLSLSETLQKCYADFKTTERECKVLKALITKYYEAYFDPLIKEKALLNQDLLEEIRLFSTYNSLFQKISLLIGIPVFLNFSKEFIGSFDSQEVIEVICNVIVKIEEQCPKVVSDARIRKEIMDFLYKLFMLFSSQGPEKWTDLKKIMLVVAQKILTPYTKEFSQTENEKLKDLISKLSL